MVQVVSDEQYASIKMDKSLLERPEVLELVERIRIEDLLVSGGFDEQELSRLDEELKSDWWGRNRERFLRKIG